MKIYKKSDILYMLKYIDKYSNLIYYTIYKELPHLHIKKYMPKYIIKIYLDILVNIL